MFVFDNDEMEIVIATYNRADFVRKLLELYYEDCKIRNISIMVLDSSSNDDTKNVVEEEIQNERNIKYKRVSSDTIIGYKSVMALMESKAKYVWIMGDSRYQDLEEMDVRVFPLIKENISFITFWPDKRKADCCVYDNINEFLLENLDSTTCIGTSIYNADLFRQFVSDSVNKNNLDELFAKNYGFAWLGYTYCALASVEGKFAYVNISYSNINSDKKIQTWAKRFYGCWCDDLCDLIEKLPDSYHSKNDVIRHLWKRLNLDSWGYAFKSRLHGDLNNDNYKRMLDSGRLQICTPKIGRLYFVVNMPKVVVSFVFCLYTFCAKMYHFIKGII